MKNVIGKLNLLFNSLFGYYIITTNQRSGAEFIAHVAAAVVIVLFMCLMIAKLDGKEINHA